MKTRPFTLSAAGLAALGAAAFAHAQYVGPSTARTTPGAPRYASVAEILKDPVDDARVSLQGTLVRQVGKEKYLFSDGTGEVRVEIDDEDLPAGRIDASTRIRLEGEIEKDFLQSPEIDAKKVSVVPT